MAFVLGLLVGALIVRISVRRVRRSEAAGHGEVPRPALARAWQEGYDAGSLASAPTTSAPTISAPTDIPPPGPQPAQAVPGVAVPSVPPVSSDPSVPPVSSVPSVPPGRTPEDLAEARRRRDRRNVNITLYTACLLLVAAASLFIGAALPVTARVAGLAVVVGLFYAGGLVVHGWSRTLRPAAMAFTGTGLALLPVAGIALDLLVVHRPAISWLVTSVVGMVLMVLAAVRLDSRVVAYLTVPFLLSTVMASGAAVQQGMVWALTVSIGLAVLMAWLSVEQADRNRWLPPAYREATARTHQWIVPGAVVAGLVLGVWIEPAQMLLLLLAASAYYATVAAIGPRRFRLASAYAVRVGVLLAMLSWAAMLQWSVSLTLTALVVYLCLQIPLVRWGHGAAGYLPTGNLALADLGASWVLAVLCALAAQAWAAGLGLAGIGLAGPGGVGFGWPAVIVVVTTGACSLVFLRQGPWPEARLDSKPDAPSDSLPDSLPDSPSGPRSGSSTEQGFTALLWQAVTPLSMVPLLIHAETAGTTLRAWNLEIVLLVTLVMQGLILGHLRSAGHRWRIDARIAPHVMAAAAVALAFLLTERLTGTEGPAAQVAAGLTALAWATATALRQGPLTGAEGIRLPVVAWAGASLLALLLLLGVEASGAASRLGWYVLAVVTGAVALWWLTRGLGGAVEPRVDTARLAIVGVGALSLACAVLRFAVADTAAADLAMPAQGSWDVVLALGLLTGWLVTAAVLTSGRLPQPVRVAALLAGQGSAAMLVASVTDRLGGDDSAARAAAAVTLISGLALRQRLAERLRGTENSLGDGASDRAGGSLTGRAASWLVTGAVGLLWLIELGTGGDRAALMVIAGALITAGAVLGAGRGGHWAVLAGGPALVVAASEWFGLSGGWLPEALFPASAAVALLVILALAVTAREIAAAARGAEDEAGAWWADLAVFRPVAVLALGMASMVLAFTGDVDGTPHPGALSITVAAGGLAGYVFARTRGLDWLVLASVVGVPTAVWLLTFWWQGRGLWFPDGDWRALGSGLVGLAVLGWWAVLDARSELSGADPGADSGTGARVGVRAAILWQGSLAVVLVTAVATVLDLGVRAGLPEDAVVWTGLAAAVGALWLTVAAWGRRLLWPGPVAPADWVLNGRDAAVVLTWAAASRAWWQTAVVEDAGRAGWWHVQVLVLVLVGLGLWHASRPGARPEAEGETEGHPPRRARWCLLAAASVFTLAAVYVLVNGTAGMQLTVLIGFALLVVLGLTRREQPLTWWGAAGVALSVLWYLRGYTYIYLALLGLVLIVLAVRQLRRHQSR